jgi:cytidylate kinase
MAHISIITISGLPGSGKSSTGKLLAKKLGYSHFSTGDMMRRLGSERGLDITSTNLQNESDRTLDDLVDGELERLNKEGDKLVIDSRMAWHFIPKSFSVYLHLDRSIAADRVLADKGDASRQASEVISSNKQEYIDNLEIRLASEARRYLKFYGVNPYDESNYDLVINTEHHTLEDVVDLILTACQSRTD